MDIRSRIIAHRRLPASSLSPHPQNWRVHPASQVEALNASLEEVGFARSLLAYEDPEWGLTLIDGHARQEQLGDTLIDVEIVDVTREEAKKLLLSLDPLASLAGTDHDALAALLAETEAESPALAALWASLSEPPAPMPGAEDDSEDQTPPEQFLVLVTCKNEKHQAEVLQSCNQRKWKCKAMTG